MAENYTQTGQNFFSRWSSKASYLPFIGAPVAGFMGFIGTIIDAGGWLLQGKIGSAATAAVAGAVATSMNMVDGAIGSIVPAHWWINAGSGIMTGESLGNHARALTENVVGSVGGALGFQPTVLSSHYAGIGNFGGSPVGPGQFATAEANRRGADANQMYNNYRNGNAADYAALENARRAQAAGQYRG